MKHVIICPGHYAAAPGAVWKDFIEFNKTTEWVTKIADLLAQNMVSATIVSDLPLTQKVDKVNEISDVYSGNAIAIDLHFNSAGTTVVRGAETLFAPGSVKGKALATEFHTAFYAKAGAIVGRDRGVKEGWHQQRAPTEGVKGVVNYFLRATKVPAIIPEPLFMCQFEDITTEEEQIVIEAIVEGIVKICQ